MQYPNNLTVASQVVISSIQAGETLFIGGASAVRGAAVIRSKRGKPNTLLEVNADNYKRILGDAYHRTAGTKAEPLRQLHEALQEANCYVVRVVADAARYPVINLLSDNTTSTGANSYATAATLPASTPYLTFFVIDGDDATNRAVRLNADTVNNLVEIDVIERDATNTEIVVESHIASLDVDAVDDYGRTAFIEDVLQRDSKRINAIFDTAEAFDETTINIMSTAVYFVGGTDGGEPVEQDYLDAVDILKASNNVFDAVFACGNYEPAVLTALSAMADDRLIKFFYDLSPSSTYAAALSAKQSDGITGFRSQSYHFPYLANDPFSGGKLAWGISGAAFAAFARSLKDGSGSVRGVHKANAGQERGLITRSGAEQLNAGILDKVAMYQARINVVGTTSTGALFIDDALTCHPKTDYLLFSHVSAIFDEISRQFHALATQLKHEPDGVTRDGLRRGVTAILDGYVASGALVKPRNPETDGDKEYVFTIEQNQFDLWEVKWSAVPTGIARRIVGSPHVVR